MNNTDKGKSQMRSPAGPGFSTISLEPEGEVRGVATQPPHKLRCGAGDLSGAEQRLLTGTLGPRAVGCCVHAHLSRERPVPSTDCHRLRHPGKLESLLQSEECP